ncbi:Ig-like domain-containing protein [Solimonas marina]|uniref:BIG2 domain-containing protein n=1 Tax=Solimonas marina TaxID=2714601 RepID=A0A969WDJ1_9GAMM|nr:Ig-like domain-containing protein [Solimonas marina]NKF24018.1 hypothetical protein [Solimonas marina]
MKRFGLPAIALALLLSACGGGSVKSPDFEPTLESITISPTSATVGSGETQQFTATGTYSTPPGQSPDPSQCDSVEGGVCTRDITGSVTWTSSDTDVATIEAGGLATGAGSGTTTITASMDGQDSSVTLTGEGLVLRSLVVTTPQAGVGPGQSTTYTAQGKYSDGTVKDVTDSVIHWALDPSSLGTIAPTTGKTVTITAGTETGTGVVTATTTVNGQDISGTAQFGVGQLTSLTIDPASDAQPVGRASTAFTATGVYSLQTGSSDTFELPVAASWSAVNAVGTTGDAPSLDASCDTVVSTTCKVAGHAEGSVTITATYEGMSATATLTVTAAVLDGVQITPDPASATTRSTPESDDLPLGSSQTYYALYYYSDAPGTPLDSPRSDADKAAWSLSGTSGIVSIAAGTDNSIVVSADAQGSGANLVATAGSFTDSVALTVSAATVDSLVSVTPSSVHLGVGRQQEFTAVGHYSDGTEANLADGQVTWRSSDTTLATIDETTGVATAGTQPSATPTTITAMLNSDSSQTATASLYVDASSCSTPLLAADGATAVEGDKAGICLLCGVSDPGYVIDADKTNAATINVGVGALDAYRSIDVTATSNDAYTVPFAAGSRPAFIISNPNGPLVLAQVLAQIKMSTLLNGAVQETTGDLVPLRLDLLGIDLINLNETQALVSFKTSKPYDGLRMELQSGTATALSSLHVSAACATSEPPIQPASGIQSLEAVGTSDGDTPTLEVGATLALIAHDYTTDAELNAADVDWHSSNESIATVDAAGVVTAVGAGTVTITGTLKDSSSCGTHCSATQIIDVTAAICETPLRTATQDIEITSDVSGLCLTCSARDLGNVVDSLPQTYGSVFLPVALLGGSVSVTAEVKPPYATAFPAGQTAGFVISSTNGKVLTAELASSIVVQTLSEGELTGDSSDSTTPLRLDLLGASAVGSIGDTAQPFFITTTKGFDGVRITFNSGLLSALSSYNLYTACAKGPQ